MPTLVKICGVTTTNDALAAARLGADYLGLNFYTKSPRLVDDATARAIVQAMPGNVTPVGLFVNEPWEVVRAKALSLGIGLVQVHGDQPEPCPFPDLRWIPAFPLRDEVGIAAIRDFLKRCRADSRPHAILVDAHVPGAYGGTGRTAPWQLLMGTDLGAPLMLAGGLTPVNVAAAVRQVRPWAVDVASGVESRPGTKDCGKMQAFIEAAKRA